MKYIRWTLNIIQFVVVFFIFFFILQEFDPFEQIFGYSFDFSTLNAGVSLIIAFSFRKIYNKASLSIMKITFFGYLPLKWKRLSRVVVKKKNRGEERGKEIMKESIKYIVEELKEKTIVLAAQKYLEKFYRELGFIAEGEEYLEDEIPHQKMILKLL